MRRTELFALGVIVAAVGCSIPVSLDNPLRYREVSPSARLRVPCYYALTAESDALVLKRGGYLVKMGPAFAEQLRAALGGVCRGTGRVHDAEEFRRIVAEEPGILFTLSASPAMSPTGMTWAVNRGQIDGEVVATGPSSADAIHFPYSGTGALRQYFAQGGSGAEGLRHALGAATQAFVDRVVEERSALERLAGRSAS